LAGHGPRPRAPGDSVASVQVHQSFLNNFCEQLAWEGKTFSLPQLREDVSQRLNRHWEVEPGQEHDEVQITFARQNAVRMRCEDGRIELNLAIAQLKLHQTTWHDFVVRVFYKPNLSVPQGLVERDGPVQLIGDRLGPKAQLALRSIFSKTFSQSKHFNILPDNLAETRPGLANLSVAQFDVDDEWIGLAFGTQASPTRQARK
jgi:hypothetical protein